MSVTTTDNARITEIRHVLADYDLHHSQPSEEEAQPAPEPSAQEASIANNPPDWETEWRRVPPYRPIQNQLDEQRNSYNNAIEQNFIRVMFGGVFMMAVGDLEYQMLKPWADFSIQSASTIWRATGGKFNSSYFQYKIGGEW